MSNMSYCRFENTYHDLKDCQESLESGDELSELEEKYMKLLLKLCKQLIYDFCESTSDDEED